jgi:cyclase
MKRILVWVGLALLAGAAILAIRIYQRVSTIEVARVSDHVHVIYGFGSNVGVLETSEGAVVVDTMTFQLQGREIRDKAEELGGGPARVVINTHYHLDHTHGNPAFPSGLQVVSTDRTLAYMQKLDADYWKGDAAGTLPNDTFADERELDVGGRKVRLLHPGRGHTDGDLVVLFVDDGVLHTGDLFVNHLYPNIDLEGGGSTREWVKTLDRVLALDFQHVIPGHGPVTDRAALVKFQDFMRQLASISEEAAKSGRSLAETQADAVLDQDAGYEVMAIPFVMRLDRDFVVKRAWEEGTGNFERVKLGDGK